MSSSSPPSTRRLLHRLVLEDDANVSTDKTQLVPFQIHDFIRTTKKHQKMIAPVSSLYTIQEVDLGLASSSSTKNEDEEFNEMVKFLSANDENIFRCLFDFPEDLSSAKNEKGH